MSIIMKTFFTIKQFRFLSFKTKKVRNILYIYFFLNTVWKIMYFYASLWILCLSDLHGNFLSFSTLYRMVKLLLCGWQFASICLKLVCDYMATWTLKYNDLTTKTSENRSLYKRFAIPLKLRKKDRKRDTIFWYTTTVRKLRYKKELTGQKGIFLLLKANLNQTILFATRWCCATFSIFLHFL